MKKGSTRAPFIILLAAWIYIYHCAACEMHTGGEDPGGTAFKLFICRGKKGAISRALVIFHRGRQWEFHHRRAVRQFWAVWSRALCSKVKIWINMCSSLVMWNTKAAGWLNIKTPNFCQSCKGCYSHKHLAWMRARRNNLFPKPEREWKITRPGFKIN